MCARAGLVDHREQSVKDQQDERARKNLARDHAEEEQRLQREREREEKFRAEREEKLKREQEEKEKREQEEKLKREQEEKEKREPTHGEDLASNIELCNISCEGLAEHALLEDTFTAVDRSSTG